MIINLFLLIHQQLAQNLYTNSFNTTKGILTLKMTQYYANISTQNKIRLSLTSLTQEHPLLSICNNTFNYEQEFKYSDELKKFFDENCIIDQFAYTLKSKQQQVILQQPNIPTIIAKNQNIFSIDQNQSFVIIYSESDSQITLSIDLLDTSQCINNCKNVGRCQNGYCECKLGFFGIDCSLESKNIQQTNYFQGLQLNYLDLIQLQTENFVLQFNGNLNFLVVCYANQIEFTKPFQFNKSIYIDFSNINQCKQFTQQVQKFTNINIQSQFIIITNTSQVIQLENSYQDQNNNMIVIIVLASIISLILIIIIILFLLKHKRQNKKINKLQYGDLMPAQQFVSVTDRRNQQSEDQHCSICLEHFTPESLVRLTYCEHVFHSKCLTEWMQKNKVCPLCRAALDTLTISSKKQIQPKGKNNHHILQQLNLFQRHDGSLTSIDGSLTFHSPVVQQQVAHKPSRFMLK